MCVFHLFVRNNVGTSEYRSRPLARNGNFFLKNAVIQKKLQLHPKPYSYSGKDVTFQESFFAGKRKLSKMSRLLRQAATGNCPGRLRKACVYQQKRLLKGNIFAL